MMKVLIIDDEKPVRECINLLVDWKDYNTEKVLEADDGYDAIQLIKRHQPELILTDIKMPVTNGLMLMDWIYHNAPSSKVIAISGYTDYDYVRQIFLQGGVDYILKPIQPQKLHEALKKAISLIEQSKLNNSPHISHNELEDDIYYQIKTYIEQNYNQDLSLALIANQFHLSEAHLSRKFKSLFGMNLVCYLKQIRIAHAKKYLIQTNKKISDIAFLVGYEDEKYFSRVFKTTENISAHNYRQKYQVTSESKNVYP